MRAASTGRAGDGLIPVPAAIADAVQWVAWCGGAWLVNQPPDRWFRPQRRDAGGPGLVAGETRDPSCMKRSCQRQTTVLPLPTARMIAMVPAPSPVSSTIRARQTCFCGLLRSRMIDCKQALSAGVTSMVIPLCMPHNCTNHTIRKL